MNPLTEIQITNNRGSRDSWEFYRSHREKITAHLAMGLLSERSQLCVLGAGNGNDLDLGALLDYYEEIHLVDLDAEALAQGTARQDCGKQARVHRYGGVDVTGVLETLGGWSPQTVIQAADLSACTEEPIRRVCPILPGPFTVVASTCLLSQLIKAVIQAVGERHPRFLELLQAVRAGHLRLLTQLVAPGGFGVLISDMVSSDTFPGLATLPESALESTLVQLIRQGNFFHGLNPSAVAAALRTDTVLASQIADMESLRPWRWNFGPRVYAVWGMKWHRHVSTS